MTNWQSFISFYIALKSGSPRFVFRNLKVVFYQLYEVPFKIGGKEGFRIFLHQCMHAIHFGIMYVWHLEFLSQFPRFTIRCTASDWLRRGQNLHCIMGKMLTNKCHAIRSYTWACFKWPKNVDKMTSHWNTQYNNNYVHNRYIYFKIITCVTGNLLCNWQAQPHGGACFVTWENWFTVRN